MTHDHRLLALLGPLLLAGNAAAQDFNLDVGAQQSAPLPSASYGAAAARPGQWFGLGTTAQIPVTLTDITGAVTTAVVQPLGGFGDFYVNNPAWLGDDGLLMKDAADVGGAWQGAPGGAITWNFSGLQPGDYAVYTYALAPDFPGTYRTRVDVVGGTGGPQVLTGNWSGSPHVLGVSYARHDVTVGPAGTLTVVTDDPGVPSNNLGTVNGFQLVYTPGAVGTSFCLGDGSATACPCGNASAPGSGAGCLNSLGTGATLGATGAASLAADSVLLAGAGMPNSSALYFQGGSQQNGGLGSVFGDGLRCAGGSIIRLATKVNAGGASTYPGAGDPSVSVRGLVGAPGTRTYQVWYRNAASFCTPSTFNLSNGLELAWAP
ncbi:MAG: hypothetical protein JNK02_15025 [Planctomycetes bacterium]|nr:hypothetical protein [Planctomycetota bacterium]